MSVRHAGKLDLIFLILIIGPLFLAADFVFLAYEFHEFTVRDIREQVTQATALVEAHMARQDADVAQILACQDRIVKHEEEILAAIHERKLGGLMSKRRQSKQSAEMGVMPDDWFNAK